MKTIPITEDELTRLVAVAMYRAADTKLEFPDWYRKDQVTAARTLARKMMAAELMYEALKRNRSGYSNLMELDIVPKRFFASVEEELRNTDAALAAAEGRNA